MQLPSQYYQEGSLPLVRTWIGFFSLQTPVDIYYGIRKIFERFHIPSDCNWKKIRCVKNKNNHNSLPIDPTTFSVDFPLKLPSSHAPLWSWEIYCIPYLSSVDRNCYYLIIDVVICGRFVSFLCVSVYCISPEMSKCPTCNKEVFFGK